MVVSVLFVAEGVIHRVVQHSVHDLLVRADVVRIAVEDLAHAIDARGLVVSLPEILLDVLDGVDTETVDCIR